RPTRFFLLPAALVLAIGLARVVAECGELRVLPAKILLGRPEASQQVLVIGQHADGRSADLTREVTIRIADPRIASIDRRGVVLPVGEGRTEIVIERESETLRVPVEVTGLRQPTPISFEHEIVPILTKARCNSGGCHGKADGQNGFKLSVFGFDPPADHAALVKEARGRRVVLTAPAQSPLILKAAALVPHGGGRKIAVESLHYRRLARWIAEGAPFVEGTAPIVALQIEPAEALMLAGETQQLQVTAIDAAGAARCVTAEAEYETNAEPIAQVDPQGLIQAGDVPGEASVLVRYMGQVAICRVTHPQNSVPFVRPPEASFVDRLVWNKLERLGIHPSEPPDDATFLRRAFLDTIGTLPTQAEAREFLSDATSDKRARLIDRLLTRGEYADYWTLRWSDLLRVDQDRLLPQGAVAMTRWLHRQLAENRPYDEFVREIITARGNTFAEGPAGIYRVLDTPEAASRSFSQLFLGVRIECAQCHHHPFERWGQDDYYALAGFFTGVTNKGLPGGSQAVLLKPGTDLKHPRTEEVVGARALGTPAADFTGIADRREILAAWMTASENPYFARVIANRLWAHYFGRGLVEPIDDFRATNPATNEPLLTALAEHLRELKYDLRAFTRTLLNSRVYQLSAATNATNATDLQNFSHAHEKALPAEVLLDAISQATGAPEKFPGWPEGYRAIQIWDNRLPSYFFRIFGRPLRASVCECERSNEPSISQALHLMNSPEIQSKIQSASGRARRLAANGQIAPQTIIEELCLATLSRLPSEDEKRLLLAEFARSDRRAAAEDVLWALLNSKEFLYNH
ncbi:MAG TPA: DUF1549 and DUF1553 domain-containing protein, partial [Planctomycetaceae bacterium]|nr:DUF1549 and DUF1553 domain-containing protein [Planctomycetaceae bacterium]